MHTHILQLSKVDTTTLMEKNRELPSRRQNCSISQRTGRTVIYRAYTCIGNQCAQGITVFYADDINTKVMKKGNKFAVRLTRVPDA